MIHAQTLDLVEGDQNAGKEQLMFLLKRERESVDDGSENLQKFGNAIEPLRFIYELEEDIVDRSSDVRSQVKKLAVNAVEGRL